ncbi:hypothetical protein HDV05_001650 [Chytridiales sp. JEL 0842]|nr:hypothetical protein HDV05_001650 [Chytridiales sp. JEL 0842]
MRLVVKRWKCVMAALSQSMEVGYLDSQLTLDSPLLTNECYVNENGGITGHNDGGADKGEGGGKVDVVSHPSPSASPYILNPHTHPHQNPQPTPIPPSQLSQLRAQSLLLHHRDLLNAYTTRHATHLHTLTTLSLTLLRLPSHCILLSLLFVKRLLGVPTLPPPLSTPAKLLLAGLILADAHLSDRTISLRTWSVLTSSPKKEEVATLKRAALECLGWDVGVRAEVYSAWLKSVRGFFNEERNANAGQGGGGGVGGAAGNGSVDLLGGLTGARGLGRVVPGTPMLN